MMDITILEPFTVLDVPALSFQLFNKTIDQNSRIKTLKEKKITIQNKKISLKEAFAQIETQTGYSIAYEQSNLDIDKKQSLSLKNVAPQKTKSGVEAFNVLQHFTDFIGSRPITSAITRKHKELLQINHNLLRRLSKRN